MILIMNDTYGRNIDYMRISITDLCNLRCRYCMPEGVDKVPMHQLLSFEEIKQIAEVAASLGISKIKLTGGEPLVRHECANLIGMLFATDGIEDVTLTTNGVLLKKQLPALMENGLKRVNVSLDTLNRKTFQTITGCDELETVLDSIYAAEEAGLQVKINAVLQQGVNEQEWKSLIELAKNHKIHVRFIEMMPIGYGQTYAPIANEDLLREIKATYPGTFDTETKGYGPATYIQIPGFKGSIGFISAMHGKFCSSCNRIRLTSLGLIKPCLCFGDSVDIRNILRGNADEEIKRQQLKEAFLTAIEKKPQEHHFESEQDITERKRMIEIGG